MNSSRRFHYQLDSLLRKRELDSDQLRKEQAEARTHVDACARALQEVDAAIMQTQTRLRTLGREGEAIDPDVQARLGAYLRMLGSDRNTKSEKLADAQRELDDIGARLRAVRESIKALEKHREGRLADFETHWRRRDQTMADELWLLRRPAK